VRDAQSVDGHLMLSEAAALPERPSLAGEERSDDLQTRCRLVIINQYYFPDVSASGQLLHMLALELSRLGLEVAVFTAPPAYGPRETWIECPRRETIEGVRIRRVWTTRLSKDRLLGRLLNITVFVAQATPRALFSRSDQIHVYTTSPPFIGMVGGGVSLLRRHPYVILLHDAYPQVAVWVGTIRRGSVVERVWHAVNRFAYQRATATIVLCEAAKHLICRTYDVPPERVHVIHNWADGDQLKPKSKQASAFAREYRLVEPFTVLYSGNLGLYYDFETILDAAERLRGDAFRLVLIGAGGKKAWLEREIAARHLDNVLLLPYQPLEQLPESLTACDASLVTIARGIEGISFPSKLYSALAAGKPVLALCEPQSELRRIVEEGDAGLWAEVGDGEGAAARIRDMMRAPQRCAEQGRNARLLFEQRFTREHAARAYAEVLRLAARA
jgi:glycosyltransferase involved in cell wall biosynthesis